MLFSERATPHRRDVAVLTSYFFGGFFSGGLASVRQRRAASGVRYYSPDLFVIDSNTIAACW